MTPDRAAQIAQLRARASELQASIAADRQAQTSFGDRLSRGVSELRATGAGAAQAFGEITGIDSLANYGREAKEGYLADAERAAPAPRSFLSGEEKMAGLGETALQVIPSLGAMMASAGGGAALGSAILPGPGTLIGGALGLGLSSFGMNLGDQRLIMDNIDPKAEANLTTLGFAGAATVPDLLTGGFLSGPAKVAKEGLKAAAKAAHYAKRGAVGTAVGTGAVAANAGLNIAGAELSIPENEVTEERADAYFDQVASASILGAMFTGPAAIATTSNAYRQQARDLEADEVSPIRFDEDDKAYYVAPNPLVHAETGVLSDKLGTLKIGRAVDQVTSMAPDNIGFRDIASDLDMNFSQRVNNVGKHTVNSLAQIKKADALELVDQFGISKLSKKERDQVRQDKINGVDTPWTQKLKGMFSHIRQQAEEVGIKMGDLGETYFPFHPDIKAIGKNREDFVTEMSDAIVESRTAKGIGDIDVDKIRKKVRDYSEDLIASGGLRVAEEVTMPQWMADALEAQANGDMSLLQRPAMHVKSKASVNKKNHLEMHRELSEVPEATLQKWARKDMDLLDQLEQYVQLATERIEYARKFGADNEMLHERVRLAAIEGYKKGKPVSIEAIDRMYDLANLQQRITNKRVSPGQRNFTRGVKTAMNYSTLLLATIPSLLEPLFQAPKVGTGTMLVGGAKAVGMMGRKIARNFIKRVPRSEQEEVVASLNSSMREALTTTAARLGEDTIDPSRADSALFKYNGLALWTEFTREWAQISAMDSFKKHAKWANDPRVPKHKRREAGIRLAEVGLDVSKVNDWVDGGSLKTDPYYNDIRLGAINLAEDVIFNPKPVSKPMWQSDPGFALQMFSHLKTFPLQFTNKLALPVIQNMREKTGTSYQDAAKTVFLATLALGGFSILDQLKTVARTGSLDAYEEKSDREKIISALAQYGGMGLAIDPLYSGSHGGTALEAIAGPAASKTSYFITDVIGPILYDENVSPESVIEKTMRMLPNVGGLRDNVTEVLTQ